MTDRMIHADVIFGYARLHYGTCCDCCNGYCPRGDWAPEPDVPLVRYTHDGREWISDRYLAFDAATITGIPEARVMPGSAAIPKMPSRATGPATGAIGDRTLAALDRWPALDIADSDVETMHALTIGGEMVGYAMKVTRFNHSGWLAAEHLDRARIAASKIDAIGEPALLTVARILNTLLKSEEQ